MCDNFPEGVPSKAFSRALRVMSLTGKLVKPVSELYFFQMKNVVDKREVFTKGSRTTPRDAHGTNTSTDEQPHSDAFGRNAYEARARG